MTAIPPDRWRFPREPKPYQRFAYCAEGIFWISIVIGGGKGVLAIFYMIFTAVDFASYGAPPGKDGMQSMDQIFARGSIDLAIAAGLLVGGVVASGILAMLVEIARNVRRHRMVQEIAQGLKAADPPGVP